MQTWNEDNGVNVAQSGGRPNFLPGVVKTGVKRVGVKLRPV